MKNITRETYVADFETSHEVRNGKQTAWVWCAGYSRIGTNLIHRFGNIKDFIKSLETGRSKKVYFHNLKFDGDFLLSYYLSRKYKYSENCDKPKQMKYLIDETGNFYMLIVTFQDKDKKVRQITFMDSYKLYPYSLSKVAKQFGFEVTKGDLDHKKVRYKNHERTAEEQDYFDRDIIILRTAIEISVKKGLNKMTLGANALANYKDILNQTANSKNAFKTLFPLLDKTIDGYLRKAYKGGCVILKKGEENKRVYIHSYDVNSMYPAQLRSKPMPFGTPRLFKGKYTEERKNELYVQRIRCRFYVKPNHLPTIQLKNTTRFSDSEWVEECNYLIELTLTNTDLKLFLEHYDVYDLKYLDGIAFKSRIGLFSAYIDTHNEIKQNTTDLGEREFAKLFMNNIYGKFGTNPTRRSARLKLEKGIIRVDHYEITTIDTIYLPIAIWTTAYSREMLIRTAQANYDSFVYCDTDCIHSKQPLQDIEIHPTKLGAWKKEYTAEAVHLKQKTYIFKKDEEYLKENEYPFKAVCAGLNQEKIKDDGIQLDFDNFYVGAEFNKLVKVRCAGGCYLDERTHKIT